MSSFCLLLLSSVVCPANVKFFFHYSLNFFVFPILKISFVLCPLRDIFNIRWENHIYVLSKLKK